MSLPTKLTDILKKYWGYDKFRENQIPVLQSITAKQDTLAIMSTGGGKSLCFQIPALYFEGITIVVSPLIALMMDQTQRLKKIGIEADALHSGLSKIEQESITGKATSGVLKLLYVSPERLYSKRFTQLLNQLNVSLLVVDEAHCISQYGHDFRPSYRRISVVRELHKHIPILAVTATATPKVVSDIASNLQMQNENILTFSSRRNNLKFRVYQTANKRSTLLQLIASRKNQAGIIYARNRKLVTELASYLSKRKCKATHYHAGLSSERKNTVLEDWLDNKIEVVVATNAFGMGIDKSDVRYVIHYDLPPSLEDYVQEAGRAGRDSKIAEAVIIYHSEDQNKKFLEIEKSYPSRAYLQKVYRSLCTFLNIAESEIQKESQLFNFIEFCNSFSLLPLTTYHAISRLENANYLFLSDGFHAPSLLHVYSDFVQSDNYHYLNPKVLEILKTIIRLYDGIIHKKVKIDERNISKHCSCKPEDVQKVLKVLHRQGHLEYIPQSDLPKIKILGPRRNSKRLVIPTEILEDRKSNAINKLRSLINYLEDASCRQANMDRYFGEANPIPCGKCDNCLRIRSSKSQDDHTFAKEKLLSILSDKNIHIHNLNSYFGPESEDLIISLVQRMEEENLITIVDDLIILNR